MSTPTAQFDPALNRQRAEKIHMLDQPMRVAETALAAAEARLGALVRIDPDHRLSYLMSDSWGFNSDHIRQVNRVVDEFLDTVSRRDIRRIAAQALSADKSPQAIVPCNGAEAPRPSHVALSANAAHGPQAAETVSCREVRSTCSRRARSISVW